MNLEEQISLIKPFTHKEIKDTMFSINSNKSLGLDGFDSGFFKNSWSIVGNDVIKAINEFFTSYKLPKLFSTSVLVLIPKVSNPSNASEYSLISCCSTFYKCITKLICNRLNLVLPSLINDNQVALLKGRMLGHNVLIIQDLLMILWQIKCLF